jgi:hypothetical protein
LSPRSSHYLVTPRKDPTLAIALLRTQLLFSMSSSAGLNLEYRVLDCHLLVPYKYSWERNGIGRRGEAFYLLWVISQMRQE